jgi:hypothetical protein
VPNTSTISTSENAPSTSVITAFQHFFGWQNKHDVDNNNGAVKQK